MFCSVISTCPSSSPVMSILWYVGQSPGSRRPLSKVLRPREVIDANKQVNTTRVHNQKKRGQLNTCSDDAQCATISKYACQHGPAIFPCRHDSLSHKNTWILQLYFQPCISECRVGLHACAANEIFVVHIFRGNKISTLASFRHLSD